MGSKNECWFLVELSPHGSHPKGTSLWQASLADAHQNCVVKLASPDLLADFVVFGSRTHRRARLPRFSLVRADFTVKILVEDSSCLVPRSERQFKLSKKTAKMLRVTTPLQHHTKVIISHYSYSTTATTLHYPSVDS